MNPELRLMRYPFRVNKIRRTTCTETRKVTLGVRIGGTPRIGRIVYFFIINLSANDIMML